MPKVKLKNNNINPEERELPKEWSGLNIWERVPGESVYQYELFCIYKNLGYSRLVKGVLREIKNNHLLNSPTTKKPVGLERLIFICYENYWVARAKAWDMHMIEKSNKKVEDYKERGRIAFEKAYCLAMERLAAGMETNDIEEVKKQAQILNGMLGRGGVTRFAVEGHTALNGQKIEATGSIGISLQEMQKLTDFGNNMKNAKPVFDITPERLEDGQNGTS